MRIYLEGIGIKFPQEKHARADVRDIFGFRKRLARFFEIVHGHERSSQVHVGVVEMGNIPLFEAPLDRGNCVLIITKAEIELAQGDIGLAELALRCLELRAPASACDLPRPVI